MTGHKLSRLKIGNSKGITLIELAIVIIISGLILAAVANAFFLYNLRAKEERTKKSLNMSQTAISEFQFRLRRYPCPADPALGPGDAQYGREQCTATGAMNLVAGRDADGNGTADNVLIGSIPINTLLDPDGNPATTDGIRDTQLTNIDTTDGWSNKLTYAVTQSMTTAPTFNDTFGAIDVRDENNSSLVNPVGAAHMVVISHGENGRGAYTKDGVQVSPCGAIIVPLPAPPGTTANNEIENCEGADATFLSGLRYSSPFSYNDDFLRFELSYNAVLWAYTSPNQVQNTNPGNVGIGVPDPQQSLEVSGNLGATAIRSIQLCDPTGLDDCMTPEAIGGDEPAMSCPPGQAIVAVEQNAVTCAPFVIPTGGPCVNGVIGLRSDGSIVCAP